VKCYVCAQEDKESDAVAICSVCGMGLCLDHVIRDDIVFWERELIRTEMAKAGDSQYKIPKRLPRILCEECYKVLNP
jgi:hypothetical protein